MLKRAYYHRQNLKYFLVSSVVSLIISFSSDIEFIFSLHESFSIPISFLWPKFAVLPKLGFKSWMIVTLDPSKEGLRIIVTGYNLPLVFHKWSTQIIPFIIHYSILFREPYHWQYIRPLVISKQLSLTFSSVLVFSVIGKGNFTDTDVTKYL